MVIQVLSRLINVVLLLQLAGITTGLVYFYFRILGGKAPGQPESYSDF